MAVNQELARPRKSIAVKRLDASGREKQAVNNGKEFASWCMPVCLGGYIKCKEHDFL